MKFDAYKIPLDNNGIKDYYGKEIQFYVFVLPGKCMDHESVDIYLGMEGYGIIDMVFGVPAEDTPEDIEEWVANMDADQWFRDEKLEMAKSAF